MEGRWRSSKAVWPLLLGLAATIGIAIVLSQASKPASPTQSGTAVDSPTAQVTPASAAVATEVAVPTPDLRLTDAFLATDTAWKQIVGMTAQYLVTTIDTAEPGPTGIVEGADAGFSPLVYSIQNRWYGTLNGHLIGVYAGALADDGDRGMVYVIQWLDPRLEHRYLTPLRAGPVHVVAEQNLRLTLVSTNGTTFYFDVPG
jgi:hypothetical protein